MVATRKPLLLESTIRIANRISSYFKRLHRELWRADCFDVEAWIWLNIARNSHRHRHCRHCHCHRHPAVTLPALLAPQEIDIEVVKGLRDPKTRRRYVLG